MRFGERLRSLDVDVMLLEAIGIGATLHEQLASLSPEHAADLYVAARDPNDSYSLDPRQDTR